MASVIKNIEYIRDRFSDHSDYILKKIDKETISISQKSTKFVSDIAYTISNYVDFINHGKYDGLNDIKISDMKSEYDQWLKKMRKTQPIKNYIESNKIILDYRLNNVGYYWVDLETHFNKETAYRLNNCGRVNPYQNLIELREFDEFGYNFSRILVVISKNGVINQVRGDYNTKPDSKYNNIIFDFFMDYQGISGFNFLMGKGQDLTLSDLSEDKINLLKKKRPELFEMSLL